MPGRASCTPRLRKRRAQPSSNGQLHARAPAHTRAGVGLLYGGVFGAIAYSTRPAPFIRENEDVLDTDGALLVCDIVDSARGEDVRELLLRDPAAA